MRYCLVLVICCCLLSCNRKTALYPSGEVGYLSGESTADVIGLQARGFAKKKLDAYNDAERRAFEYLLFRGIPDSPQGRPLISEPGNREEHRAYFNRFFEGQQYRNFITETKVLAEPQKDKRTKEYTALVSLKVNLRALRQELQREKVMPKFGL